MSHFLPRSFFLGSRACNNTCTTSLSLAHRFYLIEWRGRPSSPGISDIRYISTGAEKELSFACNYLVQTLGFSPESATLACKRLNFETPDKPNSVLTFFKTHGFSPSQISELIRKCPQLLTSDPGKILRPKLDFFYSKGASKSDVVQIFSRHPVLLVTSLERKLVPSFNFLNSLFKSETETLLAVKRAGEILRIDADYSAARNVEILREVGVPNAKILTLLVHHPRSVKTSVDNFKETVEEVRKLGFDPKTRRFVAAVMSLRSITKPALERKINFFHKCGWFEEEFLSMFKKYPGCIGRSEDKITAVLDFFARELGWKPSMIAKYPIVLSFSLKRRIAPRASVAQMLISNGLLNKVFSLTTFFGASEKVFLDMFVHVHEEQVPGLMKLYREKVDLAGHPVIGIY